MDDRYYIDMIKEGNFEGGLIGLQSEYRTKLLGYAYKQFHRFRIPKLIQTEPQEFVEEIVDDAIEDFVIYVAKGMKREIEKGVGNYLAGMVHHAIYHVWEKRKDEVDFEKGKFAYDEKADRREKQAVDMVDFRQAMTDLIAAKALFPCQRVAFTLRYLFELSPQVIAKLMSSTEGSVSACISQGKSKIAKYLQSEEYYLELHSKEMLQPEGNRYRAEIFMHNKPLAESRNAYEELIKYYPQPRPVKAGCFLLPISGRFELDNLYYIVFEPDDRVIYGMPKIVSLSKLQIERNEFYLYDTRQVELWSFPNEYQRNAVEYRLRPPKYNDVFLGDVWFAENFGEMGRKIARLKHQWVPDDLLWPFDSYSHGSDKVTSSLLLDRETLHVRLRAAYSLRMQNPGMSAPLEEIINDENTSLKSILDEWEDFERKRQHHRLGSRKNTIGLSSLPFANKRRKP